MSAQPYRSLPASVGRRGRKSRKGQTRKVTPLSDHEALVGRLAMYFYSTHQMDKARRFYAEGKDKDQEWFYGISRKVFSELRQWNLPTDEAAVRWLIEYSATQEAADILHPGHISHPRDLEHLVRRMNSEQRSHVRVGMESVSTSPKPEPEPQPEQPRQVTRRCIEC